MTPPTPSPCRTATHCGPSRALITPHTANPSEALVRALAKRIEENVTRFQAGQQLTATIDVEAGY